MNFKITVDCDTYAWNVIESVNEIFTKLNLGLELKDISEEEGIDDYTVYGLVKDGEPLYTIGEDESEDIDEDGSGDGYGGDAIIDGDYE